MSKIEARVRALEVEVARLRAASVNTANANELLSRSIKSLVFSGRVVNSLNNEGVHDEGIKTVRELVATTGRNLLQRRNFGRKSLDEVEAVLKDLGLSLGTDL